MIENQIILRDLRTEDEEPARRLILAGLEEHWGWLDESLNPDLRDLLASYGQETFLTAWLDSRLVGTGALIRERAGEGRIVRMSVARDARRAGIGRTVLEELCRRARQRGFSRLVLETTETWQDARGFYENFGFQFIGYHGGDAHYFLDL